MERAYGITTRTESVKMEGTGCTGSTHVSYDDACIMVNGKTTPSSPAGRVVVLASARLTSLYPAGSIARPFPFQLRAYFEFARQELIPSGEA